jgi:TonB family protein
LGGRGRILYLVACLGVFALAWWGTTYFANRMFAGLPVRDVPEGPVPLTPAQIEASVRETQDLNAKLREQKAAQRAFAGETAPTTLQPRRLDEEAPDGDAAGGAGVVGGAGGAGRAGAAGGHIPDPGEYVPTDRPAEPVSTVRADYPATARAAGTEGTVIVQALVGADGAVHDTRILRSVPALNDAAVAAVRRWRFRPAQQGGAPVATWVSIPVSFRR